MTSSLSRASCDVPAGLAGRKDWPALTTAAKPEGAQVIQSSGACPERVMAGIWLVEILIIAVWLARSRPCCGAQVPALPRICVSQYGLNPAHLGEQGGLQCANPLTF